MGPKTSIDECDLTKMPQNIVIINIITDTK